MRDSPFVHMQGRGLTPIKVTEPMVGHNAGRVIPCRNFVMTQRLPQFLGFHSMQGRGFTPIEVTEPMVGHKLGEFSPTRTQAVHKKKEAKTGAKKINPKTGKSS